MKTFLVAVLIATDRRCLFSTSVSSLSGSDSAQRLSLGAAPGLLGSWLDLDSSRVVLPGLAPPLCSLLGRGRGQSFISNIQVLPRIVDMFPLSTILKRNRTNKQTILVTMEKNTIRYLTAIPLTCDNSQCSTSP